MFGIARTETLTRILAARKFLDLVPLIEASKPTEAAICKGLVFVYLYGAYEYVVRSVVQAALSEIQTSGMSAKDLRRELLSLALDPLLTAVATVGRRRLWQCRAELFAECEASGPLASLDDTLFPSDGSHYRSQQLRTIWSLFGIAEPVVPELRHLGRIEELVENRNAISHGRRTAEEIGRRYSRAELESRIDDVQVIALHIVETMRKHCGSGALRR